MDSRHGRTAFAVPCERLRAGDSTMDILIGYGIGFALFWLGWGACLVAGHTHTRNDERRA